MKYQSSSKGEVEIAEMATPWLANSWRKLGKEIVADERGDLTPVLVAMHDELVARGCKYDADAQQWVFPPKEATP